MAQVMILTSSSKDDSLIFLFQDFGLPAHPSLKSHPLVTPFNMDMLGNSLRPKLTEELERDSYGAFISSNESNLLLAEVRLSKSVTHAYLIDAHSMQFYVDNFYWASTQTSILQLALNEVQSSPKELPVLTRKAILSGAWHFGHLIGDHAHRFIMAGCQRQSQTSPKPIHLCIDCQSADWIFNILFLEKRNFFGLNSQVQMGSSSRVRLYELDDCICYFPADDKSLTLTVASDHVRNFIRIADSNESPCLRVFLTSQRTNRIINSEELCTYLHANGWEILNPYETESKRVLEKIANADSLLCENGSILFNCFLARSKPYWVFCSQRSTHSLEGAMWAGGGIYNHFHKDLLSYFPCKAIAEAPHPYSDAIAVDIGDLDIFLRSAHIFGDESN